MREANYVNWYAIQQEKSEVGKKPDTAHKSIYVLPGV